MGKKRSSGACKQTLRKAVSTLGCHGAAKAGRTKASSCADKKKAAQALGCHGGKTGGKARARSLSAKRRKEIAAMGARAKGRGKRKRGRGGFFKGQAREI